MTVAAFVLGMLTGGFVSIASSLAGVMIYRIKQGAKTPKPPKPICICEHNFNSHKDNGGKCNVATLVNYEWRGCACLCYIGPDPILSGLWIAPTQSKEKGNV